LVKLWCSLCTENELKMTLIKAESPAPQPSVPTHAATADALVRDLLNSIEQGVLVWEADSICQMFNERIFTVLEIGKDELDRGAELNEFLYKAVRRNEVNPADIDEALTCLAQSMPHTHKRRLRSGRQKQSLAQGFQT